MVALKEFDWYRLWWIIWRVCLSVEEVSWLQYLSFIFPAHDKWGWVFQGWFLMTVPAWCQIWPSDQTSPHIHTWLLMGTWWDGTWTWWDVSPWRHWCELLRWALKSLVVVQCCVFIFTVFWHAFRGWKLHHPELTKTDETHSSHFLKHTCVFMNASKGHLHLLMLQVSMATLQFWSDFFFFFPKKAKWGVWNIPDLVSVIKPKRYFKRFQARWMRKKAKSGVCEIAQLFQSLSLKSGSLAAGC